MDNDFLKGMKIALGFLFVFAVLGIVYASGWHYASEIIDGTFGGDYVFNGTVDF